MYSVGTNYTSLAQLLMHRIKQHVKQGSNMSYQISQSVHILNAYLFGIAPCSFFLVRNVRYIIIAYIIGTCNSCSHVRLDMDQARTKPSRVWVVWLQHVDRSQDIPVHVQSLQTVKYISPNYSLGSQFSVQIACKPQHQLISYAFQLR